ncbi:unnamed protein product [Penicillium nalgiovense]|uniref:Gamma-glutamylcyclotransferase AIG2-like domain-containing protein n=1 Tax=Penicillium nalgiovense TaxID=60175 RepID=A0A9W4HW28_PENNA|nr:unnamed protein product [Penicillium nalgiovense]CAG7963478.1 unnamed protein product [Penicillium nalgiovense]CAG7965734.1 unnamed protein product [Penicillium nalgiovense]CAG7969685.1 unnamed protein product [Penicillium nalgiovense]CAG7969820.1 unnamed protein product [Penicillium nalgiovense]
MDPHMLSQALKLLKQPPVMGRARVTGFEIKLWGPYPAPLGKPLHSVEGVACEILSQMQLDRLAAYETDKYRLRPCLIDLLDSDDNIQKDIEGVTFMWNGQQNELREGMFYLKQWKRRSGWEI